MRIATMLLAGSLVLTAGCSGTASVKEARSKVDTFHRELDKGDVEGVWRDSSADVTGTPGNKETMAGLLTSIHARLGKVKDTRQNGWKVNYDNGVSSTELTMTTTFEHGSAEEHFVFSGPNDNLKLAGYHIDSK